MAAAGFDFNVDVAVDFGVDIAATVFAAVDLDCFALSRFCALAARPDAVAAVRISLVSSVLLPSSLLVAKGLFVSVLVSSLVSSIT